MSLVMDDRNAPAGQDARWDAVDARDPSADGAFVYAVRTTGVYCRPSCPSRAAKRQNVAFYATGAEAEAAGYRPCRRCRPDAAASDTSRAAVIAEACRRIEEAEEPPALDDLAKAAKMSPSAFHRRFKAVTGLTPKGYADAQRARRVREELGAPSGTIAQAIYGAGFGSGSRFYERANATLGMTPTAFRNGGLGTRIRFAVGECSLGSILVARSDRGICAILLGDDPEALTRELQDRFPRAELLGGDAGFDRLVARAVGLVEAPRIGFDLPLDLRGTVFQQRVWQALRGIPAGETVSYSELARRIGVPKSVRAVASACAANRIAVAIPCHRVVRTDGSLSGYRWGVERKRALLAKEASA